ncbi:NAD(P)H-hydrate dehydratase [Pseudidiomarina marina]|uniref:Bifunctional NAD(P)H-hydrate repair enzyme n=1 Tax=Pseudidiomarina marina TaxID=502366 RepID=A0A432YFX5_9GAMM|nr:NAD(P)H-hydrate dehydratase [Pseudidiomarina marina]RUO59866.1 bifunctional ADP-dependent NAD(P)H-hydrate dehydratase/NAD(P)H-hydrate epimerase [Pseudidiomarina marina]
MSFDLTSMIYTAEQVRTGEQQAAAACDVSMAQLMQRAAQACLGAIQAKQPAPANLLIVCGPGNNGGDGWVLARLAQHAGYKVQVAAVQPSSELAVLAAQAWRDQGGLVLELESLSAEHFQGIDIVIDAMLGNGLNRNLTAPFVDAVELINRYGRHCWILSVDVPTGLDSDTGVAKPTAVQADCTVTMIALKVGLVTGEAADYCGDIVLADLGISKAFFRTPATLRVIQSNLVSEHLQRRRKSSHKGDYGHVLIVGGGVGMSGAAVLAGRAALRCGAGKVSIACHRDSQLAIASAQPELMVHAVANDLTELLEVATTVVIGPGLGQTPWARVLVEQVAKWPGTVVWDADALNSLAKAPLSKPDKHDWLFTPHPAEAARLLRCATQDVTANRLQALTQICQNFHAYALLKGAGTLVKSPYQQDAWVCRRGSPALAVGGSGDVLSGVVGALLAQNVSQPVAQQIPLEQVLAMAAWLHAVAGENAAQHGERGTLPSDLMAELRALVNPHQLLTTGA